MVLRRRPQRDDAAREETVKPTSRASNLASLSDVAAALEPLRAASNQAGLAGAVCSLLVSTVAVVCRVDRLEADAPVVMIARAAAEGRPDVATPDGDLAGDAAAAGVFDVVPDSGRRLSWVAVPLAAHRRPIGVLRLALPLSTGLTAGDLASLHGIGDALAAGLAGAELHEETEQVSQRLQQSLLPNALPLGP